MVYKSEEYELADRRAGRLEDLVNALTDAKHLIEEIGTQEAYDTVCGLISTVRDEIDGIGWELDEAVENNIERKSMAYRMEEL